MHVEVRRCKSCHETFSTEKKLSKHITKYHKASTGIECGNCSTIFKNKKSLSVHKAKQICITKSEKKADKTENAVTEFEETEYEAENIEGSLTPLQHTNESLHQHFEMHIEVIDNEEETYVKNIVTDTIQEKIFQCEACPKIFQSKRGLWGHKETHKDLKVQPTLVSEDSNPEEHLEQIVYYDDDALNILQHGIEGSDYFVADYNERKKLIVRSEIIWF